MIAKQPTKNIRTNQNITAAMGAFKEGTERNLRDDLAHPVLYTEYYVTGANRAEGE